MSYNFDWVTAIEAEKDWLYKRLADKSEGWSVNLEENNIDVPLNELDAAVYKTLLKTIEARQKTAITLPRIKSGVTLSLVAYLVVNRLIKASKHFPFGFTPTTLTPDQRIIILTKNRKLRDFFLKSSLNFGHSRIFFSDLAVERLNRLGKFEPIGRKLRNEEQLAPITFYHFDNIEELPIQLNNSLVIAEFTETDSQDIVKKFLGFTQKVQSCSTLVLLNSFDKGKLSLLESHQFNILNISKENINGLNNYSGPIQMPSLASSLSPLSSSIKLHVDFINDEVVDEKLQSIFSILMTLSKELQTKQPVILMSAWNLFYCFKNLAVPLDQLEEIRKKNLWVKSLRSNIDKIFNAPLIHLDKQQQDIIQPAWGTLKLEFNNLYNHLSEKNSKYERLIQIALDVTLSNDTTIVFTNGTEANLFKEELFNNHDWFESEKTLQIRDIQQMLLDGEIGKNLVIAGAWRPRDIPRIIALLPKEITILSYPSEVLSILKSIKNINMYQPKEREKQTETTLSLLNLYSIHNTQHQEQKPWIIVDEVSTKKLEEYGEQKKNNQTEYDEFAYYEDIEEHSDTEEPIIDANSEVADELIPAYHVSLENGTNLYIARDQQIIVYSIEADNVQTVFPESLHEGDMVLLYSYEQNQEMFQEAIQRTRELAGINERYINLWKTTVDLVRRTIDERYHGSYVMTIKILKDLGCNKSDATIRQWFKGLTIAPQDRKDIEAVLEYCGVKNVAYLSERISEQMEILRSFNRTLGKRLKHRLTNMLRSIDTTIAHDKIEQEIDEILESAEIVTIQSISINPINIPKAQISKYIF